MDKELKFLVESTSNVKKHLVGGVSRPAVRGRVIFGEIVPWGRSAGEYSIFTMPAPNGWTMMFNKESAIWGTEYNPEKDVLRIPMLISRLQERTELLTFEIVPAGIDGIINVIWDQLKASFSFTTKN